MIDSEDEEDSAAEASDDDDDDEDEDVDDRPNCWYGMDCFRKNPQHFEEFKHVCCVW